MNIDKFTRKSKEAIMELEKTALDFGNQEIDEEHLLYVLLTQEDSLIAKLLEKNTAEGEGVLSFSAKDLKRLPSDFASKASEIAAKNNGKIKIADEAADIEDGFILSYGGIEENCTLKALFSEKEDELRDCVHSVLWQ